MFYFHVIPYMDLRQIIHFYQRHARGITNATQLR